MRYAKVLADHLTVRDAPGGAVVGSLIRHDRVLVIGHPVPRERTWWRIERGSLGGWVADGDGKVKWLELEPEQPAPLPAPPDYQLPELPAVPVGALSLWPPVLIVAVVGAIAWLAWLFSAE